MDLNIFWGLYILLFSVTMFIVWYFVYLKRKNKEKRCSEKTIGKIIRYSTASYNNVHLPVVEYYVNDKRYTVVGPKFKLITQKKISNFLSNKESIINSNLTNKEKLPNSLKYKTYSNGIINIKKIPLYDLYPINGYATVYYNPLKPKESYVERYIRPSKILNLILLLGIILLLASIYLLFYK